MRSEVDVRSVVCQQQPDQQCQSGCGQEASSTAVDHAPANDWTPQYEYELDLSRTSETNLQHLANNRLVRKYGGDSAGLQQSLETFRWLAGKGDQKAMCMVNAIRAQLKLLKMQETSSKFTSQTEQAREDREAKRQRLDDPEQPVQIKLEQLSREAPSHVQQMMQQLSKAGVIGSDKMAGAAAAADVPACTLAVAPDGAAAATVNIAAEQATSRPATGLAGTAVIADAAARSPGQTLQLVQAPVVPAVAAEGSAPTVAAAAAASQSPSSFQLSPYQHIAQALDQLALLLCHLQCPDTLLEQLDHATQLLLLCREDHRRVEAFRVQYRIVGMWVDRGCMELAQQAVGRLLHVALHGA